MSDKTEVKKSEFIIKINGKIRLRKVYKCTLFGDKKFFSDNCPKFRILKELNAKTAISKYLKQENVLFEIDIKTSDVQTDHREKDKNKKTSKVLELYKDACKTCEHAIKAKNQVQK